MAFSDRPRGGTAESDSQDAAQTCAACLIDLNKPGQDKSNADRRLA